MMMESLPVNRKEDILAAAETLFAHHGYDGASVDEIAAAAQVNKATIYYYFKSKQAILDNLIEDFMQEMRDHLVRILGDMSAYLPRSWAGLGGDAPADFGAEHNIMGFMESYAERMLDFFEQKKNILRIMLMESLKEGENRFLLFRFTDLLQEGGALITQINIPGMTINVDHEMLVTKFFGGILPLVFYAVSCDAWAEHYQTNKERLKSELNTLFRMMTVGYFQTHAASAKEAPYER